MEGEEEGVQFFFQLFSFLFKTKVVQNVNRMTERQRVYLSRHCCVWYDTLMLPHGVGCEHRLYQVCIIIIGEN